MARKKMVVAGATGLVGNAALRHFGASGGCDVVALSRRKPRDLFGAQHVQIDLSDAAQCRSIAAELHGHSYGQYYEYRYFGRRRWRGFFHDRGCDRKREYGLPDPAGQRLRFGAVQPGTGSARRRRLGSRTWW